MKRFNTFISEAFKNLLADDTHLKKMYAEEVWDLLQSSYAKVGGIKGSGFKSPEDMIANIPFWKMSIRNGRVVAVSMYKTKNGRKRVAVATDGTPQGKKDIADIMKADIIMGRSYGEVSGPSLRFILTMLEIDNLENFFIPVTRVKEILKDDEIVPVDEFRYKRKIGSEWIEKMMIGTIN